MVEVDLFQGKVKLSDESNNVNKEIFNQRIETKLSLRKKTVNNILYNKSCMKHGVDLIIFFVKDICFLGLNHLDL